MESIMAKHAASKLEARINQVMDKRRALRNKPVRHPVTGCRADKLMGDWLMDQHRLQQFVDRTWDMIEAGQLATIRQESQTVNTNKQAKPYTIEDGVARMEISGPMTKHSTSMSSIFGGTSTTMVREALKDIQARHQRGEIKALFLEGDSPGGTADGTAELASAVGKTAQMMPVYGHAPDEACSACLYVMSQCTRFTCGPNATVGSLGTRWTIYDTSKAAQGSNVKPVVIASGKYKAIGAPGMPITDDDKRELQRYIDHRNEPFKEAVQKGRKLSATQLSEVATARLFVGKDAVRVGLCDAVCTTDEAFDSLKEQIKNPAPADRGHGNGAPKLAAPRSRTMPYSETEMGTLRKIAGASMIVTGDNAEQAALQLLTQRDEHVRKLEQELITARSQTNGAVKPVDPDLLRERCQLAADKLLHKKEQGKLTSAQFLGVMGAMLMEGSVDKEGKLSQDAKPNEAFFQKVQGGGYAYEKMFAAFDDNKPNGIQRDVTNHQPVHRTEPAGDGTAGDGVKYGLARINKAREQGGMEPLTQQKFDAIYPEYAGNA